MTTPAPSTRAFALSSNTDNITNAPAPFFIGTGGDVFLNSVFI